MILLSMSGVLEAYAKLPGVILMQRSDVHIPRSLIAGELGFA
jgi:hypothetical protein